IAHVGDWMRLQGYRTYFLGAGGKSVWQEYRNLGDAFLPNRFDLARDGYRHWGRETRPWPFVDEDQLDSAMFRDASRCLQEVKGQKFFMMMWGYETHSPYPEGEGPQEWAEEYYPADMARDDFRKGQIRRYLRCIWRVDRMIGDFYRELETLGLAEDTLVIVTADHGEAYGQHSLYFHGNTLYDEDVHIP